MIYEFDSALFMSLPTNHKSLAAFLRPLGINRNTWNYWSRVGDVPLVHMLRVCKHYEYDPAVFITINGDDADSRNCIPIFRSRLFSNALSTFRNMTVTEACSCLGISTATFARQLRNSKGSEPSITIRTYMKWCELAGLNPLDYIYEGPVNITFTE